MIILICSSKLDDRPPPFMFYMYVLKLNNGRLYFGYTKDLKKRFREHNNGESTFTKNFLPVRLVYYEAYADKKDAQERERKLKQFKKGYSSLKKRLDRSIKI